MLSFFGDLSIKEKYIKRVQEHRLADELVKGRYWKEGKGCAVGCTIHGNGPSAYEKELGLPYSLGRLEDVLFESLSNEDSVFFPEQFLEAIPIGRSMEPVLWRFGKFCCEFLKQHEMKGVRPEEHEFISNTIDCFTELFNDSLQKNRWDREKASELEKLGDLICKKSIYGDERWEYNALEYQIGKELEGMARIPWCRVSPEKAVVYRDTLLLMMYE